MIEYVRGELAELSPAYAVIDTGGVGYGLNISLNTYTAIQGKKEVKLHVYESIREDAYVLFGFAAREERDMFLLLISVSGVGANTARMILSELFAGRTVRRHIVGQRACAQDRERNRSAYGTAHNSRPERQDSISGHNGRSAAGDSTAG